MDITSLTQRMHGCSKPWYLFCPRRRTSQALGLRTILPLLPCISSSFHRAALWTGPPVSFLLKQAGKSVARPCPSQARKPPTAAGLRLTQEAAWRVSVKGKPAAGLGSWNLPCSHSFVSRESGFIYLFSSLRPEKAMAPHSSPRAWKIPWTEEPGGLQSLGSRRVR